MKLEPKRQPMPKGRGRNENEKPALLRAETRPELDPDQIRQRADRMSGVLEGILNRLEIPPKNLPLMK
jgi:hypothetical protein